MKALRLHSIGDIRCDTVDVPQPHGDELLLKVGACGVCGSDLPRTFVHGSSNGKYPLTIGHEFAGTVVAVGETADKGLIGRTAAIFPLIPCNQCDPCRMGQYAMCEHYDYLGSRRDGGFAEYCLIPNAWHLFLSDGGATMETLAMTEPACVAQHAVRNANVTAGQFVVIYGAGPIGMMAARWVKLFGAQPLLVDVVDEKIETAKSFGLNAVNSRAVDVCEAVREMNHGKLADAAIEGTGVGSVTTDCIRVVRALGHIAWLGNPANDMNLALKDHSTALRKELTIRGVWNSSRAPFPVNEWAYTVSMMDRGLFTPSDLITHRPTLEEMPQMLDDVYHARVKSIKVMYCAE